MTHTKQHFAKLVAAFFLSVAASAFLIFMFVKIVDPYGLAQNFPLTIKSLQRPQIYRYAAEVKRSRALQSDAELIIFGNSRVDAAFEPQAPYWPEELKPVFNFGLPAKGLPAFAHEMQPLLRGKPRTYWIGVDFFDFIGPCPVATIAPKTRLKVKLYRWVRQHFSMTAVSNSVKTLAAQSNPSALEMTQKGFNPWKHIQPTYRAEGPYAVIQQRNIDYYTRLATFDQTIACAGKPHPHWRALEDILAMSQAADVPVTLFTHPFHSDLLAGMHAYGFWPTFENFKRELLSRGEAYGVPVYDFSVLNDVTLEAFPGPKVRKDAMAFYYEAGHYRPVVGAEMANVMLGRADGFGVKLSAERLEDHLRAERSKLESFRFSAATQARRSEAMAKAPKRKP